MVTVVVCMASSCIIFVSDLNSVKFYHQKLRLDWPMASQINSITGDPVQNYSRQMTPNYTEAGLEVIQDSVSTEYSSDTKH